MTKTDAGAFTEKIFLRSDNGAELSFCGRLYSESSYYDEESGRMTRWRLFLTDKGEQVYSIVSSAGAQKERRHYIVTRDGDRYRFSNGVQTLSVELETLFAAVFGLCGIDPGRAEELKPAFEENLRMIAGE
jgi:hypothetical protein